MSEKKMPAKSKSHGRVPQAYGTIDPDYSTKVINFSLALSKIRKDKPKNAKEFQDTVVKYFELCAEWRMIPTIEGLALSTHYYKNSLWEIENGDYRSDLTEIVRNAKEIIKQYDASMAANGMIPSSVYQFRAKNFYGMKDMQEVTLAPKTDKEPETASEILEEIPDQLEEGKGNK